MNRFAYRTLLIALSCASTAFAVDPPAPATADESASFTLSSDAFADGKTIPDEYTCDGADRSPSLHWVGAPEGTKAFALIVEDPDAPSGTFTHWLLYNMPGATKALDEGVAIKSKLGDGSMQGVNDFGRPGYGGPCPPRGSTHRYVFRLIALSELLELQPGAKRDAVLDAIGDKKLGDTKVKGSYSRPAAEKK